MNQPLPSPDRHIAVVGPGLMGLGLSHAAAAAGLQVLLVGRDAAAAHRGLPQLGIDLQKRVARGKLTPQAREAVFAAVSPAQGDAAMARCGLIVEAVSEDRDVKAAVLRRIEAVAASGAVIATNTSGLPIGGLATTLADPGRFIGLHFFSPVDRMALVEVVTGRETSPATTEAALAWVLRLGKTPIVVRDGPGFFTSRVFSAYLDEAAVMVTEGVDPAAIEAAAVAAGMPTGPLAMLDETGIELNWQQARQARADGLDDWFCRPLAWPLLDRLVTAGRRGRRDGGGFYDYPDGAVKSMWLGLADWYPPLDSPPDREDVRRRLMHAQALQAARCLEDGTLVSSQDADTASILGLGFPAKEGGVLAQVERRGLPLFVAECDALADRQGERFRPSAWLRERAAKGRGFAVE